MKHYKLKKFDGRRYHLSLQRQQWRSGDESELHLHDCVEIMYILRGGAVNLIDGTSYPVIAGDLFAIRRGETHSFRPSRDLLFYNLMFSFSVFSARERTELRENPYFCFLEHKDSAANLKFKKISIPPYRMDQVRSLFQFLYDELTGTHPARSIQCKALLVLILNEISRIATETTPDELIPDRSGKLSRLLDYVNANYLRDIGIVEIARACGIAPTYASAFFRTYTGMPIKRYILNLRLEKARALFFASSDINISEAAFQCGFSDSNYFGRMFRKAFGTTPSAYRAHLANRMERGE